MTDSPQPPISIIIPARNAGGVIDACLDAIQAQQDCPPFDVWVAVGPSKDDTRERVLARAAADSRIHLVENPSGLTPAALNAAIRASTGELVVRVDAQAQIPADYLAAVAATSARTGAANVGGRQVPVGHDSASNAVARAMASRFGAGPAAFRSGRHRGPTDTVYLGAFRREALEAVGGYDERLVRNQDYELNWRLRRAGHTVWLNPSIAVEYRPRSSLRALASQYWQYGRWKRRVLLDNPRSLRLRQAAPPALVLGLVASVVVAGFSLLLAAVVPLLYLVAVGVAVSRTPGANRFRLAAAFITMHLAWGSGFLVGR